MIEPEEQAFIERLVAHSAVKTRHRPQPKSGHQRGGARRRLFAKSAPLPMNADNEHQLSGIDCKALVKRRPETRHAVTFSTIFPKPPPASMGEPVWRAPS